MWFWNKKKPKKPKEEISSYMAFMLSDRLLSDLSRKELIEILESGDMTSYFYNTFSDALLFKVKKG